MLGAPAIVLGASSNTQQIKDSGPDSVKSTWSHIVFSLPTSRSNKAIVSAG